MEPLTLQEMVRQAAPHRMHIVGVLVALPLLALVLGGLLKLVSRRASGWVLSLLVHVAVIPGVCSTLVVGYTSAFTSMNLTTEVDVVLYFLPIVSMVVTMLIASRLLPFREIPGLSRIGGLFLTTTLAFCCVYALSRTSFRAYFWLGDQTLFVIFGILLVLFGVGWWMMFGGTEPEEE